MLSLSLKRQKVSQNLRKKIETQTKYDDVYRKIKQMTTKKSKMFVAT